MCVVSLIERGGDEAERCDGKMEGDRGREGREAEGHTRTPTNGKED